MTGTIQLLIRLKVEDFDLLREFELQALIIMADYGGKLITAFETKKNHDGSGKEVHILEFPNIDAFDRYREDPRLQQLAELRSDAISKTKVSISQRIKSY